MRILLVDDHVLVRSGLSRLLTLGGAVELEEATNAEEALGLTAASRFSLIILDLNLPGLGGMELITQLVRQNAGPILVLSMHSEPYIVLQALRAGAKGYVSKNASPEELLSAIRRVAADQTYVEGEIAQALAYEAATSKPAETEFSSRELEILRHLAIGSDLSGIARALGVSYKTVANLCTALKAKVGVSRTADLIKAAMDLHFAGASSPITPSGRAGAPTPPQD